MLVSLLENRFSHTKAFLPIFDSICLTVDDLLDVLMSE